MPSNKDTIQPRDFNLDEFKLVIDRSKELIKNGYFTGINFLQSEISLPKNSIIVHFLHDSQQHLKEIESVIIPAYSIVPRFTFYMVRAEYFKKPNFREEYKSAIFFNPQFREISIEEAIRDPNRITISSRELDLIIPVKNPEMLEGLLTKIRKVDRIGPEPWIDPVIIVRTEVPIKVLENFTNKHYVSIAREREEFYSIVTDKNRLAALEKYLDNLCKRIKIDRLGRSDIVFYPSQINNEFASFLQDIQNQLQILD
jgi:hypothetical protein